MKKKIFVPTLYPLSRDMKKTWFVKWVDAKGKEQKTYGNLNKLTTAKEREFEAKNIIAKICNPNFIAHKRSYNLVQLLSNLVEFKKPALERKSYLCYECIVNSFSFWYRDKNNVDVKEIDYFNYLAAKGLHKNTIRNRLIVLKGLCNELIEREKLTSNPFKGIRLKKVKATSKLPFSQNQAEMLKAYMTKNNPQLLLFCEFMYYLFLRPNEARQLKCGDILFDENKVCLSGLIAKDDDTIYKKIPVPLRAKLEHLRKENVNLYIFTHDNKPGTNLLSYRKLALIHKNMLKALNFSSRYSLYSWVHTGIKNAALSNIPVKELQLQKGHADLKMFDQYLKDLGVDDCHKLETDFPVM